MDGLAPAFMVNMTSDHHINGDSVLHDYEYEQDSDLDDEEEEENLEDIPPLRKPVPSEFQAGSSTKSHTSSKIRVLPISRAYLMSCYQRGRRVGVHMMIRRPNSRRNHPPIPLVAAV